MELSLSHWSHQHTDTPTLWVRRLLSFLHTGVAERERARRAAPVRHDARDSRVSGARGRARQRRGDGQRMRTGGGGCLTSSLPTFDEYGKDGVAVKIAHDHCAIDSNPASNTHHKQLESVSVSIHSHFPSFAINSFFTYSSSYFSWKC